MEILQAASAGTVFCPHCYYSPDLFFRIKGLLGRSSLSEEEGLLLRPCNSIHMFFMQFPIDALFLSKENKILHIAHAIKPWRISRLVLGAESVLEVKAGTAQRCGLEKGGLLTFTKNPA
jgi:uncharacterized protein